MTVLRQGLLAGRVIALAGATPPTVRGSLAKLGAEVLALDAALDEDGAREWAAGAGGIGALVYDGGSWFAADANGALQASLERAWVATRAVATGALIPYRAGKVLLIAPRPGAGPFATASRAGLENLARTLSVEWARYGVTAVAVAPGDRTTEDELAELVCYLVSPAGEYFSGCLFELGGP